jgi:hypothetical protein
MKKFTKKVMIKLRKYRSKITIDARGEWYMRDDRAQAAGPFPQVKGSRILHDKLREFIHRNYESDGDNCWFFQNGPQRVYVELEAAPLIWRVEGRDGHFVVHAHTGMEARPRGGWLDEQGRLFLECDLGFGLVHTMDTGVASQAIEAGAWHMDGELPFEQMPSRFGYVLSPQRQRQGA